MRITKINFQYINWNVWEIDLMGFLSRKKHSRFWLVWKTWHTHSSFLNFINFINLRAWSDIFYIQTWFAQFLLLCGLFYSFEMIPNFLIYSRHGEATWIRKPRGQGVHRFKAEWTAESISHLECLIEQSRADYDRSVVQTIQDLEATSDVCWPTRQIINAKRTTPKYQRIFKWH